MDHMCTVVHSTRSPEQPCWMDLNVARAGKVLPFVLVFYAPLQLSCGKTMRESFTLYDRERAACKGDTLMPLLFALGQHSDSGGAPCGRTFARLP